MEIMKVVKIYVNLHHFFVDNKGIKVYNITIKKIFLEGQ